MRTLYRLTSLGGPAKVAPVEPELETATELREDGGRVGAFPRGMDMLA